MKLSKAYLRQLTPSSPLLRPERGPAGWTLPDPEGNGDALSAPTRQAVMLRFIGAWLRARRFFRAIIRPDGTLQMRDPNDNGKHRYQYAVVDACPCRRALPERKDVWDDETAAPRWEPVDPLTLTPGNPVGEYFLGLERAAL